MNRILKGTLVLALLAFICGHILAQSGTDNSPILEIGVAGETCALAPVEADAEATPEPESTPEPGEPDYPIITLGDDCDDLIPLLLVANNGTLWIALSVPDEDNWQQFAPLEDDTYPPTFDGRGRYIGCAVPEPGEQVCRLLWEHEGVTYLIEIPVQVGDVYIPPMSDVPLSTDPPDMGAGWGACGSCDSCGGDGSQCVLSPDGTCLWDPGACAVHTANNGPEGMPDSGGSGDNGGVTGWDDDDGDQ